MPMGILFWILMLFWLVFGTWRNWPDRFNLGYSWLLFVLLVLLGWHEFGPPLR